MYYKFTEINDWEGETWRFYIPVIGNENAIQKLKDAIKDAIKEHDYYKVSNKTYTEDQVNTLCEDDESGGYMPRHNKLSGTLVIPDDFNIDSLYKGGIDLLVKDNS